MPHCGIIVSRLLNSQFGLRWSL